MVRDPLRPNEKTRKLTIKKIILDGYKTYNGEEVDLSLYNLFIGANASGKSNLVSSFKFIRDLAENHIEDAVSLNGGFGNFLDQGGVSNLIIEFSTGRDFPITLRKENASTTIFHVDGTYRYEISYDASTKKFNERMKILVDNFGPQRLSGFRAEEFFFRSSRLRDNEGKLEEMAKKSIHVRDRVTYLLGRFAQSVKNIVITRDNEQLLVDFELKEKNEEIDELFDILKQLHMKFGTYSSSIFNRLPRSDITGSMELLRLFRFFSTGTFPLLERIKIFDFEAKRMKNIQEYTVDSRLYEDGSNLALVLKKMEVNQEQKKDFVRKMRRLIPSFDGFRFEPIPHTSAQLLIIKEKFESGKTNEIGSLGISDGTIVMMGLVYALFFDDSDIIILEEPERSVHPALITEIMHLIREASTSKQVIVTTHNPEFLRCSDLENIQLVYRSEDGYSHVVHPTDLANVKYLIGKEIGIEHIFTSDNFGV